MHMRQQGSGKHPLYHTDLPNAWECYLWPQAMRCLKYHGDVGGAWLALDKAMPMAAKNQIWWFLLCQLCLRLMECCSLRMCTTYKYILYKTVSPLFYLQDLSRSITLEATWSKKSSNENIWKSFKAKPLVDFGHQDPPRKLTVCPASFSWTSKNGQSRSFLESHFGYFDLWCVKASDMNDIYSSFIRSKCIINHLVIFVRHVLYFEAILIGVILGVPWVWSQVWKRSSCIQGHWVLVLTNGPDMPWSRWVVTVTNFFYVRNRLFQASDIHEMSNNSDGILINTVYMCCFSEILHLFLHTLPAQVLDKDRSGELSLSEFRHAVLSNLGADHALLSLSKQQHATAMVVSSRKAQSTVSTAHFRSFTVSTWHHSELNLKNPRNGFSSSDEATCYKTWLSDFCSSYF